MRPADLHVHTAFCDGKNTPEEMVRAALDRGLAAIGFSGHACAAVCADFCMTRAGTRAYVAEVRRLREKYAGQIEIYLGIEQDLFSDDPVDRAVFDYAIGSVHCIEKGGEYLPVDESEAQQRRDVEMYFGGDWYAYTAAYYELVSTVIERTGADIVGHFDLVTKFNRGGALFDEGNPRYMSAALAAAEGMARAGAIFEINTGAISRGYQDRPYPAPFLLRAIHDWGGRILLSGDSHDAVSLCACFDQAAALARRCGFTECMTLTPAGFVPTDLP